MANTLDYAQLFMDKLDKHAVIQATSGWMENNAGQVEYNGGDTVNIPTLSTQGLADYDRAQGFTQGSVSLKWEPYKMTQDRGRTFTIDDMDLNESKFVLTATNVLKEFQERRVIPEIDAYRYSKIATIATENNQADEEAITADNALSKLLEHIAAVEDVVGVSTNLVISMPSSIWRLLNGSPKIDKLIDVANFNQGGMNFKIKRIDEHFIRIVPSARLKTAYNVLDGKTSGQEEGGLEVADGAKDINWIITPMTLPLAISKTDKIRVFEPSINQSADAYKLDYRKYHDLWIKKNKVKEMMVSIKGV